MNWKWNIHTDWWMEWVYLLLFLNYELKVKYSYWLMDGMSLFASLAKSWSKSEIFIHTDGWNEFIWFSSQIMKWKWNIHTHWWMEWVYLLLLLNHEVKVKYLYYLMDGMSLFASLPKSWIESEIFILSDGWNEFICFSS